MSVAPHIPQNTRRRPPIRRPSSADPRPPHAWNTYLTEFVVEAKGYAPGAIYVQSATLNGAPLTKPELRQAELRAGGSLVFTMGTTPSSWGR